jgi:hypothetical protein
LLFRFREEKLVDTDDSNTPTEQLSQSSQKTESSNKPFKENEQDISSGPKQEPIKRILHLLQLLGTNECTRQEIFERLAIW